ncbi:MAG TPA: DUF3426 domain-containing protein [Syntrophales bacterium]|nr:DUF3426 domain-containing protein [Syntrophales bacterium]
MIIQCEKCLTKYRFDDNLMEGDGIWVRCSRCKHEFFQENLFARSFPSVDEEAVLKQLDDIRSGIKDREPEDLSFENLSAGEESVIREGISRGEKKPPGAKSGFVRFIKVCFKTLLILVLLVVFAGVCLWSYMQAGGLTLKDIRSSIPYLDQLIPTEDPGVVKLSQIRIVNVKQRYVQHWILGNLLVVEGTAWNSTPFPVARIRVEARLFDAKGTSLVREEAFAGNLLTDMELTTLPDENIKRELATSRGTDVSNDRVEPRGQIPFMIVFTQTYPMLKKTTVHISGVEKLLTP